MRYGIFVLPISALLLGGVGGYELLTNTMNITMIAVDNIGQTQFIVGISFGEWTNIGVTAAPTIDPSPGANDNKMVANNR